MRANTGEQLREINQALKQDQRNYLHEVMQLTAQRDLLADALLDVARTSSSTRLVRVAREALYRVGVKP